MRAPRAAALWCRRNLFADLVDTAITVVTLPLCAWLLFAAVDWALATARWSVVPDSLRVFMVGVFPTEATWRAWIAGAILAALTCAALGSLIPLGRAGLTLLVALALATAAVAFVGDVANAPWILTLEVVAIAGWIATSRWRRAREALLPAWAAGLAVVFTVLAPPGMETWGGLLLSFLLTIVASTLSLPLGILLALGRRSRLVSLKLCCTAYIEMMRSVPLILVVYWIWIVVPLLAPDQTVSDVLRGMVGFVAFFCAYVAEYVRSGLQSVPEGRSKPPSR